MNYLDWCNNVLEDQNAQKAMEEKITALVNTCFTNKGEYAVEKFVKSFSETIIYLESSLRYSMGIHHNQIKENGLVLPEKYIEKSEEVKKILLSEINRLGRHYSVFLA